MKRFIAILSAAAALAGLTALPAQAAFGLNGFQFALEEEGGAVVSKGPAGSHPFAVRSGFHLNFTGSGIAAEPEGQLKNIEIELPAGFAGNPSATPTCPHALFLRLDPETSTPACPDDTALGVVIPEILEPGPGAPRAIFNLDPPPGVPAEIGFSIARVPITIDFTVKQSQPYNVTAAVVNSPQPAKIYGARLVVWGNPANAAHDEERGSCIVLSGVQCHSDAAETPFITLPRACAGPLATTYSALSWQGSLDAGAAPIPLEVEGCEHLGFHPEIDAQPTNTAAGGPSGLDFELKFNDSGLTDPQGDADSDIRAITATLPEGLTVNPSSAEGQGACSSVQLESESLTVQGCPEASRLGSIEVETPLLEGKVLPGSVYLATQGDNPFHTLLAFYVVVKDPDLGILVKLPAKIDLDPTTGQLVSSLDGLPQLPFSSVRLHFRNGPRAPLVTPATCGEYQTKALLVPWAAGLAPVSASSSFKVSTGCRPERLPFAPSFIAGTVDNAASTYSPFDIRLTRADGEAELSRLSATLPAGVVPKLAGVSECSEATIAVARLKSGRGELADPSCPASSLIGHVQAGAGVGSALTWVPGSVYLAGPFNGDPLSAVAIVPAVAGPLDIGNVVTRVALTLNPATYLGEIDSAASEPFPHILAGVPLRLRDLRVFADRPKFTLNATSCEPESATASVFGLGITNPLALATAYQASGCRSLGFSPKLSLKLSGGTKRNDHPRLQSIVTYPYPSGPGYANIDEAIVTLPPGEQIDNAHINNPCTRVQFNANQCPPKSVLGTAKAVSPLLDKPLEGPVYFRSNGGEHLLPDIVADLKGQVSIVLVGHVDAVNSRVRTSFENVPDAPVTKFTLSLYGGKKGLLVNNRDICKSPQKAKLTLLSKSNRLLKSTPTVANSCRKKGRRGP
ncbi:MAG: hypothetical protein H0X42_07105 [Solirubrobacterales bacterium]|nr:hypothetical protein [Solirubrobacterales bacterium]